MSYCSVEEMREEGFEKCDLTDRRVQNALDQATADIEAYTGRFFEPRNDTIDVDWRGSEDLLIHQEIIAIDEVSFVNTDGSTSGPLDVDDYVVFNRHVRQGLLRPDDREAPKISLTFVSPGLFIGEDRRRLVQDLLTRRVQNMRLKGRFGYTDPDPGVARTIATNAGDAVTAPDTLKMVNGGFKERDVGARITIAGSASNNGTRTIASIIDANTVTTVEQTLVTEGPGFTASLAKYPQSGSTPRLIRRACALIAAKFYLGKLASQDPFEQALSSGRLMRAAVRDQSLTLQPDIRVTRGAEFTGDPTIDTILARYFRPLKIEAV